MEDFIAKENRLCSLILFEVGVAETAAAALLALRALASLEGDTASGLSAPPSDRKRED